jgi:NADH-quinone oxidoreductase subunit M
MLNGFVGEFLILAGTFVRHMNWASYAAIGIILSAVYLLWAYQRVFFGEVTQEKNRTLPDADRRERLVLVAMAAVILWMGIGSVSFTHRTEASARNVFVLMQRPQAYNARAALNSARPAVPVGVR